ncbi:MAG TPA: AAA family ATPase, partial [Candidatus Limnocylindrales bacterium]|nr:AAA family ATPase [Candidatus Limnocylindrales bacterium]
MRLLERDAPLATLDRLRTEAASAGGRLVFLEGEAGIGKTSLIGAFRAGFPGDVTGLLGSCDSLSTPRPLGPLVDVADDLDPAFARAVRDRAPRDEVLGALLAALRNRGDRLVLLLDDLHWADEATLDALRYVGRRIETTRSLVVGTYRDDEVGPEHPLRVVVGDLASSPAVRRLPLAALSRDSVEELADGSGLDPAELHRLTGGNPFYVTEVIAGAPARIPPTVRDAVLAKAARLSPAARRTLEAAAVIGAVVEPGLLLRVVDPVATDECVSLGLLVVDQSRYRFRHEVAREAILGATDPSVRIGLHAR